MQHAAALKRLARRETYVPLIAVCAFLAIWQLVCMLGLVPAFLLPSPVQIVAALIDDAPLIWSHTLTTLIEAALGLVFGIVLGFVLAVLMDRFETLSLAVQPFITLSQTVPTIAIAPLLVLWFGYGLLPKVILIVLTTFFPVAVSLYAGFRSVDPDVIDLMRTMRASELQIFWYAKLPAAADQFFSGLTISATYAIVSAVIAEWLGGFSGLGVYMTRVRKSFSYDRMFASILVISLTSLILMWLVGLIRRACTPWLREPKEERKR